MVFKKQIYEAASSNEKPYESILSNLKDLYIKSGVKTIVAIYNCGGYMSLKHSELAIIKSSSI